MRIYVSGTGAITSFGAGSALFFDNCLAGNTIVRRIPDTYEEYTTFKSKAYSPIEKLDYQQFGFSRGSQIQNDPVTLNAIIAAGEALDEAGIEKEITEDRLLKYRLKNVVQERCGVIMGSGIGGASAMLDNYSFHLLKKYKKEIKESHFERLKRDVSQNVKVNPFVVSMTMSNCVPANIGITYGLNGPNHVMSIACASGTAAIGMAYQAIKNGEADLMITGGSEFFSDFAGALMMSFDIAGTLANTDGDIDLANRPFDEARNGFLFSEGAAGALILESEAHLVKRGGTPLCEVLGYETTFDAFSMMAIDNSGKQIERMHHNLLNNNQISKEQIDYINTHGTSTKLNDETEAKILKSLYGTKPFINSTKSILGHSLGASGALEGIVCVKSIDQGKVHVNRNLINPINDLNYVMEKSVDSDVNYCISESFAFGGHNTALLFGKV